MIRFPNLRAWSWSSLAVLVLSCGIVERTVDEQGGGGDDGVLGTSSGSGGGGPASRAGAAAVAGGAGSPLKGFGGKPDFNQPDPAFPPFKAGGPCAPGVAPSPPAAAGGESGAAGRAGEQAAAGDEPGGAGGADGQMPAAGCARSSCESMLLVQALEPSPLAVHAGELIFVDNGTGALVETRIGSAPRVLTTLDGWITDIAFDDSWIYLQTYTEIQRITRTGENLQTLASGQAPRGLALDSSHLYFLSGKNGAQVRRISLATGAGETLADLNWTPFGIALDDDNVYVLSKAELLEIPKCSLKQTVLGEAFGLGGGLAVDAAYVYWYSDDLISRVAKQMGTAEMVSKADAVDGHFVVDGSFAYWGSSSGQVLRAPVTGGSPEVIGDGLDSPVVYAVDQQNVYFTDVATSEIRAVPK